MVIVSRDNKSNNNKNLPGTRLEPFLSSFLYVLVNVGVVDGGRHCCYGLVLWLRWSLVTVVIKMLMGCWVGCHVSSWCYHKSASVRQMDREHRAMQY